MSYDENTIEKIFDLKLSPIKDSLLELKQDVKELKEQGFEVRIGKLENDREKYKERYTSTVKLLDGAINRIDSLEKDCETLKNKVSTAISERNEKIKLFDAKILELEKELNLVFLMLKNPRVTLMIFIGLYLFAISDVFPSIISKLF